MAPTSGPLSTGERQFGLSPALGSSDSGASHISMQAFSAGGGFVAGTGDRAQDLCSELQLQPFVIFGFETGF